MSRALEVCLALVCLLTWTDWRQQAIAQIKPPSLRRVKLEDYGWQPLPKIQRGEWPGFASQLVSIDHERRVLVGFTVREGTSLATREHPGLSFHILRFTLEGKEDLSLNLPTSDYFTNGLYLGPNDQILARANNVLQMLAGENPGGNQRWQILAPCRRDDQISQSPTRRTLIVTHVEGTNPSSYARTLLDFSSSPPHSVQDCAGSGGVITDKFSYGQTSYGAEYSGWRWPLCEPSHKVELLLDLAGGQLRVLDDESFLVLGMGRRRDFNLLAPLRGLELITVDGQTKFQKEMENNTVVTGVERSNEHGDRFAFVLETWRGGSRALDVSGKRVARRIVVYNDTGQELASVPVSTTQQRDFDFSLSPDGHHLAVLDEGVLITLEIR